MQLPIACFAKSGCRVCVVLERVCCPGTDISPSHHSLCACFKGVTKLTTCVSKLDGLWLHLVSTGILEPSDT